MKEKVPAAEAAGLAAEIVSFLTPRCARVAVAGSLRRRKPYVGDVEILFIPTFVEMDDKDDLFAPPHRVNFTDRAINVLLKSNILAKRPNVNGVEAWGVKNKLAINPDTGIAVDLFTATESNWFNYLVCRTGGAENNVRIASAAQARGWKWNPYGEGFTRRRGLSANTGDTHTVQSEREVFEFVGLPYLEPWER